MEQPKPNLAGVHVVHHSMGDITALVVDYSEHIRALLTMHLRNEGIKDIQQASDGGAAIEKYRQQRPSIVFVDYVLPKMNGLMVLKQLRQIDPKAKVVIVSSVSSIEIVRMAKDLGASFYILKPWQPGKLTEVIQFIFNIEGTAK
jgi:two-component system, chemotaxis family, chemotaxis protein CheY